MRISLLPRTGPGLFGAISMHAVTGRSCQCGKESYGRFLYGSFFSPDACEWAPMKLRTPTPRGGSSELDAASPIILVFAFVIVR